MELMNKRRALSAFCVLGAFCIANLALTACGDHGVEANFFKGTVRGELQINAVVPDTTDEIRVALVESFPPSSLQGLITSGVLSANKDTSVKSQTLPFEMSAPLGTYEAAIVIWKAKDQSFLLTDIVGIFGNLDEFELRSITLTESEPTIEEVNIPLDLERVNRTSSISGTINFVGAWPSNTAIVVVVVLKSIQDLLRGIPPALSFIPRDLTDFDYRVGVAPDTYSSILVAWLPVGEFDLSRLKLLGFYEIPEQPGVPAPLTVEDKEKITGIDITADFANINNP